MKTILMRNILVAVAFLAAGIILLQIELVVSENTSEKIAIGLVTVLIVALFWAWGSVSLPQSRLLQWGTQAIVVCVVAVALGAALYYYSWHIRPALGIFEWPPWISPSYPERESLLSAHNTGLALRSLSLPSASSVARAGCVTEGKDAGLRIKCQAVRD